jgi:predicted  nucleic acid-binding Zn-ribbon protein
VSPELRALVDLQARDTRIAALEAAAVRVPREIEALQATRADARKTVDTLRARVETLKKDLRGKERDLDDIGVKRSRSEGRLWEVKTNDEYSAVLREIEDIKRQKARLEEEMLALMETQERLALDIGEAERSLGAREDQARQQEAVLREKIAAVEAELATVRGARETVARALPAPILAEYEKILRARGGLAVATVTSTAVCSGCRVTIRPQVMQDLRHASGLMVCENCGRYLHWVDAP